MRRSIQKRRKRRIHRFLGAMVVVLVGSWGGYHWFSYLVPAGKSAPVTASAPRSATESTVYARITPREVISMGEGDSDGGELALLAGTKRSASTQSSKKASAVKVVTVVHPEAATSAQVTEILNQAKQLISQGKHIQAREALNDYLKDRLSDPTSEPVREKALDLGQQTILGPKVYPDDTLCVSYKVDVGDTFVRLAKRNKVPYQFLCKINQCDDPRRLMEGQRVKLVKGPVHLKVVMHELTMYVFLQDTLFAKYDVGLGKNGKTPSGKWIVEDRIRKPVYVDPDTGDTYGPNDPNNPTGGFWIRLRGVEGETVGKTGFGIHGTTEPDSIKKFMSKGCIRMRNEDMSQVFDLLSPDVTEVYTLP